MYFGLDVPWQGDKALLLAYVAFLATASVLVISIPFLNVPLAMFESNLWICWS